MNHYTIRSLTTDDLAALAALENDVFGAMGEDLLCPHYLLPGNTTRDVTKLDRNSWVASLHVTVSSRAGDRSGTRYVTRALRSWTRAVTPSLYGEACTPCPSTIHRCRSSRST